MAINRLTATKLRNLTMPGYHCDGAGLYLRVDRTRRSWMFRFKIDGKSHWFGLGGADTVTLAEARQKAREARESLARGVNPLEARKAAQTAAEAATARTFETVASLYIAAHAAEWKNAKHAAQWEATLRQHVYARIGAKPVAAINIADVLDVLEPIWRTIPETASRVRGRIESVLDYAKARKWRTGENPAAWRGNLDHLLPARNKVAAIVHHAAVAYEDMPHVMARLAEGRGISAQCLRFTVLTAARSAEARGARWAEFDLVSATWTVPAARMKAAREHRVPLSAEAVAILRAMLPLSNGPDSLVFPGGRPGKALTDVSVSKALEAVAGVEPTVHGMRSSFRDWAGERTSFPREVAELALAHANRDKTEAAYARSDRLDDRRRLMAAWASYVTGPVETASAKVRPIRAA
jgi:integrase